MLDLELKSECYTRKSSETMDISQLWSTHPVVTVVIVALVVLVLCCLGYCCLILLIRCLNNSTPRNLPIMVLTWLHHVLLNLGHCHLDLALREIIRLLTVLSQTVRENLMFQKTGPIFPPLLFVSIKRDQSLNCLAIFMTLSLTKSFLISLVSAAKAISLLLWCYCQRTILITSVRPASPLLTVQGSQSLTIISQ